MVKGSQMEAVRPRARAARSHRISSVCTGRETYSDRRTSAIALTLRLSQRDLGRGNTKKMFISYKHKQRARLKWQCLCAATPSDEVRWVQQHHKEHSNDDMSVDPTNFAVRGKRISSMAQYKRLCLGATSTGILTQDKQCSQSYAATVWLLELLLLLLLLY